MKQNLFDGYDLSTPISDALLEEMGFKYEDSKWVYIVSGSYVTPEIYQEGNVYFIYTDEERYPGLADNPGDLKKIVYTIGDLKAFYEKATVLDRFNVEIKLDEKSIKYTKVASETIGAAKTAQDIENHMQHTQYRKDSRVGYGAEDANAMNDRWHGKKVEEVGRNNAKNGPDRISDGVYIQTKYYDTAYKTVNAAFDASGYRYYQDGKPMKLEVPKEQYEQAVKLMREKIAKGEVAGVKNPDEATNIVLKGHVTFKQAQNIAKAGNIDSLMFDAQSSIVSTTSTFGISFVINFAVLKYKNISTEDAIKISFIEGLKSGGITFLGSVFTRQILRTSVGRTLAALSTKFSKSLMTEFYQTPLGKEMIHKAAALIAKKQIYGGAARNVAIKFFRTNVLTNATFILVNTVPDFWDFMNNRKSWKELTVSIASSISGLGAFLIGSKLGAKIPVPGPLKVVLSMLGGTLAALAASDIIARIFKTKEEKKEYDLIQEVVKDLSEDYMLIDEEEFDQCMSEIQKREVINANFIEHIRVRNSDDEKKAYIYTKLKSCFFDIIKRRKQVVTPSAEEYVETINKINVSEDDILKENVDSDKGQKKDSGIKM